MIQSKSHISLITAMVLMLVIAFLVRPGDNAMAPSVDLDPQVSEEAISDLVGVIQDVATDASFFSVVLPDGGVEEIILSESDSVTNAQIGLIARVNGIRDLSTRRIMATSVAVEETQDIYVTSPGPQSAVTSPLVVFGFARTENGILDWRILDAEGVSVREGFARTSAADASSYGTFRFDVFPPVLVGTEFVLEVYQVNARGNEEDVVSVPLHLLNDEKSVFDISFHSRADSASCSDVFPATRVMSQTSAAPRAALLELLAGPTAEEASQGFTSGLPSGAFLRTLVVNDGEARADFSAELGTISRACDREKALAQISETLLQFDSIQKVIITSDGELIAERD